MSGDGRSRVLERRWQKTGDAFAEAAWIRERARTGDLPEGSLEALELIGYAPALRCTGRSRDEVLGRLREVHAGGMRRRAEMLAERGRGELGRAVELLTGAGAREAPPSLVPLLLALESVDVEVAWRAAIGMARALLRPWRRRFPGDATAEAAVRAGEAAIACPCEDHARAGVDAARAVAWLDRPDPFGAIGPRRLTFGMGVGAVMKAAAFPASDRRQRRLGLHWFRSYEMAREGSDDGEAEFLSDDALLERVRHDLAPWLLGRGDPLRERLPAGA